MTFNIEDLRSFGNPVLVMSSHDRPIKDRAWTPKAANLKPVVRGEIGPIAVSAHIEFVEALPKTRSGKIMRRVLRAKAMGEDPGDMSTLAD
jgi:acyl-coenzyme A synthetase/AMP-(fatty) acid ligase